MFDVENLQTMLYSNPTESEIRNLINQAPRGYQKAIQHELYFAFYLRPNLIDQLKSLAKPTNHPPARDPLYRFRLYKAGLYPIQAAIDSIRKFILDDLKKIYPEVNLPPLYSALRDVYFCQDPLARIILHDNFEALRIVSIESTFSCDTVLQFTELSGYFTTGTFATIGLPILYYAAACGSLKCFKFLFLNGANFTEPVSSSDRRTAVSFAIMSHNLEMIHLLESRTQISLFQEVDLSSAAKFHHNDLLEWLSDKGEFNYTEAYMNCIMYNNIEGIRICIQHGADVGASQYTHPISYAIEQGHPELVKFLLSMGCKPEKEPTRKGSVPLFAAVKRNYVGVVQELLAAGAKVNAKDDAEQTPIMFSGISNEMRAVLLEAGAQLFERDKYGQRPFFFKEILQERKKRRANGLPVSGFQIQSTQMELIEDNSRYQITETVEDNDFDMVQKELLPERSFSDEPENPDDPKKSDSADPENAEIQHPDSETVCKSEKHKKSSKSEDKENELEDISASTTDIEITKQNPKLVPDPLSNAPTDEEIKEIQTHTLPHPIPNPALQSNASSSEEAEIV